MFRRVVITTLLSLAMVGLVFFGVSLRGTGIIGWVPCIVFGAILLFTLEIQQRRRLRRLRREQALCIDRGYNLTGNVTGVCSECGSEIEQP